ncbi:L-aspartate oxidase [Bacillus massiliigorillae]|uniref:L-aspartate oxidase n=1 Tax=Bacillus massiliigorillae TaxID=1243664 RepID=UPI0003A2C70E|nr:L-aspartate oxidase [Bacillus massiliigorillae]
MSSFKCDVLIIGSGIAALQTALYASQTKKVMMVTKTNVRTSNTYLAQGGVAAAHAPNDHVESHVQDTMEAGEYHNNREAVTHLVTSGITAVNTLLSQGMKFDCNEYNQLVYGLEGAHSERRILHCKGDSTGKELAEFLLNQIQHTSIVVKENEMVVDLLIAKDGTCIGAVTRDGNNALQKYYATHTVIASGGCGMLYPYSTNSQNATGDGFALALKVGARLKDMEFNQFHPTGLYINGKVRGLVSEAVRGEGAILRNQDGIPIMEGIHRLQDLAPRHIVAQTIFSHMKKGQQIFLDTSMIKNFNKRFPAITALCERYDLDWRQGKIPVAPASHFIMGGIETDEQGRTNVNGLYAVGEVACTGVHGANRLASNSLLEGLVFGRELGMMLQHCPLQNIQINMEAYKDECKRPLLPTIQELQQNMFLYAGIVRNDEGLRTLSHWLQQFSLSTLLEESFQSLSKEEVTKAFMVLTAISIANSARLRKESRGAHNRNDCCNESASWQNASIIITQSHVEGSVVYEQVKA